MFSLSGKMDFQIPCFPCAVATLWMYSVNLVNIFTEYVNIYLWDAGSEFLVHIFMMCE